MNQSQEPMFKDAQVGDRVWSINNGWGKINKNDRPGLYTLEILFANGEIRSFTLAGKDIESDINPTLFWAEIVFDLPPRPKRKVKKTVTTWVNLYINGYVTAHTDESIALTCAGETCIATVPISGEYEVEI